MRYFLDEEFIEDGRTIDVVSIGIVAEDGREFYRENSDADLSKASTWVQENVIPHLRGGDVVRDRSTIALEMYEFVMDAPTLPEFWGYFSDYDWVGFCQFYGKMIDLPTGFPMFCLDLKQWAWHLGNPRLPEQQGIEHHALADSRWNAQVHGFLTQYESAYGRKR